MLEKLVKCLQSEPSRFIALFCDRDNQEISDNPNALVDSEQNTLLHLAAGKGLRDIVAFLVQRGATVDCQNCYKETPLGLATENRHETVVQLLLDLKARTDIFNAYGFAPIHLAATSIPEILQLFITAKAPLELKTETTGATPFLLAISKEYLYRNADILAAAGANLYAANKNKEAPIDFGKGSKNTAIFTKLMIWGHNLPVAVEPRFTPVVERYKKMRHETSLFKAVKTHTDEFPKLKELVAYHLAKFFQQTGGFPKANKPLEPLPADLVEYIKYQVPQKLEFTPFNGMKDENPNYTPRSKRTG